MARAFPFLAVVAVVIAVVAVVGVLHHAGSVRQQALLSGMQGESRKAESDYERYLMREVFNDGKGAPRHLNAQNVKLVRGKKAAPAAQHKLASKATLQTLRVSDSMSSQQAQRDLDSYWGKESKKYSPADVRDPKPASRLPTPMARARISPERSHHEQYHYVNKRNPYKDNRAEGASPWEYSWRRSSGASAQPLEKFNTQVQATKTHKTTKKLMNQQLRQTATKSHMYRHIARDLPPMPGSFEALEKQV